MQNGKLSLGRMGCEMCDIDNKLIEVNSISISYTKPILFLSTGGFVPYTWTQEDYEKLKEAIKRVKEIRDVRED